nr:MAG TPA: hypothetical protein [Caudoviricetes sp.]
MNRFKELFERVLSEINTLEHKLSEGEFGLKLFRFGSDKTKLIEYLQFLDFENFKEELYRHISNKYIVSDDTAPIYSSLKELEEYCANAKNGNGHDMSDMKSELLLYFRTYLNFREYRYSLKRDAYRQIDPLSQVEPKDVITGDEWLKYALKQQEIFNKIDLMSDGIDQIKEKISFLLEGQTCSVIAGKPTYLKPELVVDIFYYYIELVSE